MALIDSASAPSGPPAFAVAIAALRRWHVARRTVRAQHLALQSLLFMPEHRLTDLGISRNELISITEIHRK